jgi:hypothetical protein
MHLISKLRKLQLDEDAYKLKLKQANVLQMKKLSCKAISFHQKQLMIKYGLRPLRILLDLALINSNKAFIFHKDYLNRKYWCLLCGYCKFKKLERLRREQRQNALATVGYHNHLKKSVLKAWKIHRKILKAKAIAVNNQTNIFSKINRSFRSWKIAYEKERRANAKTIREASNHGKQVVKRFIFKRWLEYMNTSRFEHEIRIRSNQTWDQVKKWMKK